MMERWLEMRMSRHMVAGDTEFILTNLTGTSLVSLHTQEVRAGVGHAS